MENKERDLMAGIIFKAAAIDSQEITETELKAINKYAIESLTADDVFAFSAIMCDNEIDRQYEQFSVKALKELQKLYIGRTVIKDHVAKADNQVARIYTTELVTTDKFNSASEPYVQLKAHCYMVKTDSNKDLITEIKAGIKKEGSVSFRADSAICSICGTDNTKSYCSHWPGRKYTKDDGEKICTYKLDGVKDAYEFSLVAVPAQKAAGVSKAYMGEIMYEPEEPAEEVNADDESKELELRLRLASAIANNNN